jgi:hypothetical protein
MKQSRVISFLAFCGSIPSERASCTDAGLFLYHHLSRSGGIHMKNIKIMLWYDVEDFITPEADDALLALIDMMDNLGIRGSFKMVGEKIRVLNERGRHDILEKLLSHEICYHTENHSVHPTQTEYLQNMGFSEAQPNLNGENERDLRTFSALPVNSRPVMDSRAQAGLRRPSPY